MYTPREIYEHYRSMPGLQLHQLRVAAVAKYICDRFPGELDTHSVIATCLLHDMGNIIKSDLALFPQLLEPQGMEYWQQVRQEYLDAYGTSAHSATVKIMEELGVSPDVIGIEDAIGFSRLIYVRDTPSFEKKIAEYSDARVAPFGVLSLKDRLLDARERYRGKRPWAEGATDDGFDLFAGAAEEIERQIAEKVGIDPAEINDASVAPLIAELESYQLDVRLG